MAKQDDGKNKGVKAPKVSQKQPRVVKDTPESLLAKGYRPVLRDDGKIEYHKEWSKPKDKTPAHPSKPRPGTSDKPKKLIRPQPTKKPGSEGEDVVILEDGTGDGDIDSSRSRSIPSQTGLGGEARTTSVIRPEKQKLANYGITTVSFPDKIGRTGATERDVYFDAEGNEVAYDLSNPLKNIVDGKFVGEKTGKTRDDYDREYGLTSIITPLDSGVNRENPNFQGNLMMEGAPTTRIAGGGFGEIKSTDKPKTFKSYMMPKYDANGNVINTEEQGLKESQVKQDGIMETGKMYEMPEKEVQVFTMPKFNKGGLVGKIKGYNQGGPVAKKVGKAAAEGLGAYGSSYYAMQQPENSGDVAYNTGMQAVGQIGPIGKVIQGASAVGDQIGEKVSKNAEAIDPKTGKYKNLNQAAMTGQLGGLLNPYRSLTTVMFDKDASTGTKALAAISGGAIQGNFYKEKQAGNVKRLQEEKAKVEEANIKSKQQQVLAAREAGEENPSYYTPYNVADVKYGKDSYSAMGSIRGGIETPYDPNMQTAAKGGTIKGPGTGTSDSILSKVSKDGIPAGSFITPAKNNGLAKQIRKKVLGDNPDKVAKFEKGGEMEDDADVAVSNGEHLFTPKEKQKIVSYLGKEILEQLAPEAEEDSDEMAKGGLTRGKAKEILHDKSVHSKPLTDKQRKFMGAVASGYAEGYEKGGNVKAPKVMGYAKGGPVKGTKVGNATWDGKNWIASDGSKYTEEAGKRFTDIYNKQVSESKRKQSEADTSVLNVYKRKLYEAEKSGDSKEAEALRKKISELTGVKQQEQAQPEQKETSTTETPKTTGGVKAPKVAGAKKSTSDVPESARFVPPKVEDVELDEVVVPMSDAEKANIAKKEAADKAQADALNASLPQTVSPTPPEAKKKGILDNISDIDPTMLIGPLQAQMGMKMLKGEKRPVFKGELDPRYNKAVERAQYEAQYGLTPEQRFMAEQDIQKSLNDALAQGRSASSVESYNLNRAAANEAWRNKLGLKQADLGARMEKQQYADRMVAERAGIIERNRRQAFEDAMMGFQQRQGAGAQLVGAGLANTIGAYRFNKDLQAQKERNALDWSRNYGKSEEEKKV